MRSCFRNPDASSWSRAAIGYIQLHVVGTGNLDLKALAAVLKDTGFSGLNVLEYEGDVENPVPALVECMEKIGKELWHGPHQARARRLRIRKSRD